MDIPQNVEDYLIEFGLNEKEIKIYFSLLEIGPSSVMDVSRASKIKRSTTHNYVEELIKKGLITQTSQGERRLVVAEKPEKLKFIMRQKKWELKKIEDSLPNIINSINKAVPNVHQTSNFEVKYYKGKKEVQYIYDQVLKSKEVRAYVNALEVSKVFPKNMGRFIEAHNESKNMNIWEIMNKAPEVEDYAKKMGKDRYHYKFIPESMNLSIIDYLIFDGKVAVITIKEDSSGLLVSNKEFYENAKAIFNFVWGMI